MGSPLGPSLANIFLSFHEHTWLENFPCSFKPIYYRRYVDDCFLLFRSPEHINLFLNFLNQQHVNIKFTSGIETPKKTLSFQDIQIECSNSSFATSIYQKPTFTGLFTNFHSFIPLKYKKGLTLTLIDWFFKICSTYENFHTQIHKLCCSAFSHIHICTVVRSNKRLSHFFPFKRQTFQGCEISCSLFILVSML